jgi:hypothetical protein
MEVSMEETVIVVRLMPAVERYRLQLAHIVISPALLFRKVNVRMLRVISAF